MAPEKDCNVPIPHCENRFGNIERDVQTISQDIEKLLNRLESGDDRFLALERSINLTSGEISKTFSAFQSYADKCNIIIQQNTNILEKHERIINGDNGNKGLKGFVSDLILKEEARTKRDDNISNWNRSIVLLLIPII